MEDINTSSKSKIWWYDFIFLWSYVSGGLSFSKNRRRAMTLSIERRSLFLIFSIGNIVEFRHNWVLFTVRFVIYWLVNFSAIRIIVERINLLPVEAQNIARRFLILFVLLTRTITYQIVDWLCHPWTSVLLLLFRKYFSEKLQISQLMDCYSLLLFNFKTLQYNLFYFAWQFTF